MLKKWLGLTAPQASLYSAPLPAAEGGLEMTYLGTSGFVLKTPQRTVVLDPYLSRANILDTLTKPLHVQPGLIRKHIPHADDVLIGHAHYDHILDAPALCKLTGARLIGSVAACNVGRAAGLPESQLVETHGREDIACGEWTVRGLPSIHGKAIFGRVPLPGDMLTPPPWPPRFHQLKHGQVLNWLVDTGSLKIVHIDSADFIPAELQGIQADVVCLCAIGRKHRPDYVKEVVALLKPKWIVPCHWDTMFTPFEAEPEQIPGVDLAGMVREIEAEGVRAVVMPMRGKQVFSR
ncbi:L-ascorbate metabolism protein UlaG (beta-lactamase superfamily) [Fluviicoccus keumensis]|uniref:L-ascorbate metabolism protein UlaG (Beta-lactamase superfamily) n=1 Tax=Fluviicoccus keumensis TaxID=1435465 RepID=A0A4Q7YMW7_9GAMM|nr:L-ascorbate metabolism protein UlaG (beta-lactamase superfamily) [Fluviicoccus keumensis]